MTHDEMGSIEARINAISLCTCHGKVYCYEHCYRDCFVENFADAKLLLAEVKRLNGEIEANRTKSLIKTNRLIIELEAAKTDLKYFAGDFCDSCIHFHTPEEDAEQCHKCTVIKKGDTSNWQWRGVQGGDNGVK